MLDDHTVTDHVPECWKMDSNYTASYIHMLLTICICSSDLHQTFWNVIIAQVRSLSTS